MKNPQDVAMLLASRTHRRMHTLLDLVDLAAMDAAMVEEEQVALIAIAGDVGIDEVIAALNRVAELLRQTSEILAPAHQTLMQKATHTHDG